MASKPFHFHRGGVFIPELALWLDASEARKGHERVFVSHAHSDHTARHREVILSEPTSRLMHARLGGKRIEHVLKFGEPREFDADGTKFGITLLPAGHIFGSAMSLIEWSGRSLLYTGDFKLRHSLSAEECDPSRAQGVEMLLMETTYGRPAYRFPAAEDVMDEVIRFCRQALDSGETPVLLGYALGRSQEVLRGLEAAGLPIMLHDAAFKLTEVYAGLGHRFPAHERFDAGRARGRVLICPPNATRSAALKSVGPMRTAALTGWAMDSGCRFRFGTDAAFPLSDHADFPDLIKFVKTVAPRKVFTLHGFAADFARALRELGFDAQALSEDEQLELALGLPVTGAEFAGVGDDN